MLPKILLCFCVVICSMYALQAQDYNTFKKRLQEEENKYKDNILCEKTTKAAVHNLNELIWAKPSVDKIVKSCDFIRNQKNGCPQPELINLLAEIKTTYKAANIGGSTSSQTADGSGSDEIDAPVSNMPDTLISPEEETQTPQKIVPHSNLANSASYIIYICLGLLSLVCAWLVYKVLQKTPTSISAYPSQTEQNMKNELLEKLGNEDLIAILKQMRDQIGVLVQKISSLEEDVQLLKEQKQAQEVMKNTDVQAQILVRQRPIDASFHQEKEAPQEDSTPIINPIVSPKITDNFERRYALYMDNSEGFSVSGLMYAESAETIYEIILTSAHVANYRICAHIEAQAYALSDPGYYLRTACDYDNSPTSGRHIETLNDGQLEQVGSIWKITKKARIRFV